MTHAYLVGLIGGGIGSSLSPVLHEHEADAQRLRYLYRTIDIERLALPPERAGALVHQAQDLGYDALNITHPCKQSVLAALDELAPEARLLGAVNTVIFRDGHAVGYNTDHSGFSAALHTGLPAADLASVVLLGCGGAGSAIAYALLTAGAGRLRIFDPQPGKAESVRRSLAPVFPRASIEAIPSESVRQAVALSTGLVNATPVGMVGHPGLSLPVGYLHERLWVADAIYRPVQTELIRAAAAVGCQVLDGGRMVVGQAADTFELITGIAPDRERMRRHFQELVSAPESLSLAT